MSDADRLLGLQAAAEEAEQIAFSMTPETFFHTKWCTNHVKHWDKLQTIIDKASKLADIAELRKRLEETREATFAPDPVAWRPSPYCKIHAPLWPLIQSICAAALRSDDDRDE